MLTRFIHLHITDTIKVDAPDSPMRASIFSDSVWGILRGLETFSQLVYSSPDTGIAVSPAISCVHGIIDYNYLNTTVIMEILVLIGELKDQVSKPIIQNSCYR